MIRLEDLSKNFGSRQAVRQLSLHVPAGELFCFLGPNGAGKTTTIKMMTGLLRPSSGRVTIDGIDMQRDPLSAKRVMGYIPDMPYLYDRLTCSEFFVFTGDLYRVPRSESEAERDASFDQFGLQEYSDVLVKDLSHGLRQRLIYAATFLHRPKVLFIDEPLIGLDPKTIRMLKEMLKNKAREGTTIFLTTHILALAEDIADRIGIIMDGRLIADGTLEELRRGSTDESSLEDIFLTLTESSDE
jgi:ABC-2 type transport system ATP-binding protein